MVESLSDNGRGYCIITDKQIIASYSSKDVKKREETDEGYDELSAVMSHVEVVFQLDELPVHFQWLAKAAPTELLMLRRVRDRAKRK